MSIGEFSREVRSFDIEFKWAAVCIVGILLWVFIERLVGLHHEHLQGLAQARHAMMGLFVCCHIACLYEKRKKCYRDQMRYWDGLVCCVALTVVVLVALGPATYFIYRVISPDLLFNLTHYEIANGQIMYQEMLQRNTMANHIVDHYTNFILYGLGLSLTLPLFTSRRIVAMASRLSNTLL